MHLHHEAGARADRLVEVAQMGAVRGADLAQAAAGPRHHVGHAERAADLHQFSARDDHLLAHGERVQHEEDGRRIVVDDDRRLRTGQPADQRLHMIVALAPLAALQIEFEVRGTRHHRGHRPRRFRRERRAAEIGVQHGSRQVEDRPERRPVLRLQTPLGAGEKGLGGNKGGAALADLGQHRTDRIRQCPAPVLRRRSGGGGMAEQALDRGWTIGGSGAHDCPSFAGGVAHLNRRYPWQADATAESAGS